ncbi:MAG TPA: phospholipid carrier-dependent glycosyltransferase [Chloroflexota bacterium]
MMPVAKPWERLGLVLVVVVFTLLSAMYNAASPIFEAPDEIWHYLYVRHIAEGRGLPIQAERHARILSQQEAGQPPLYYLVAALLTFWAPRGDIENLAATNPHASVGDPTTDGRKNRFLHGPDQAFPWRGEVLTVHLVRGVSALWGVVTVLFTYLAARAVLRSVLLALAAACVVAWNPQFLYMSAAVNNDVAAAATGAALLWWAVVVARREPTWRRSALLGALVGVAVLAKPSAVGGFAVVLVALGIACRRAGKGVAALALHAAVAAVAGVAVCGWWFARNAVLYGDAIPLRAFLGRERLDDEIPSLHQVLGDLTGLKMSYWALFGWFSVPAPPAYYALFDALMALGAAGLLALVPRRLAGRSGAWSRSSAKGVARGPVRGEEPTVDWGGVMLVACWALVVIAALLRYRLIVLAFQGRLAFGAIGAVAILLVLGWSALAPRRLAPLAAAGLAATLLVPAALAPWTVIAPAYAPPPLLAEDQAQPQRRLDVRLGDAVRLLGVDLSSEDARPGEEIAVTVYLQALRPMGENYSLFLHVLDWRQRPLTKLDTYPGRGAWPTSFWRVGEVVVDRYRLRMPTDVDAPLIARVAFGLYALPSMERLPVHDAEGRPMGSTVYLATLALRGATVGATNDGVAFDGSIVLMEHAVETPSVTAGSEVRGSLTYGARRPVHEDYTIFVHLVGSDGKVVAQDDSPPRRGAFPTTFWRPGDRVRHEFVIPLPSDLAPGDYALVTGWYDPRTGQRLTTPRGDSVSLGTVMVESARPPTLGRGP